MSKTIDQRVVQMEFDNSRFERNVSTTMSTLEKLKQKLNFNGASKGLENVSAAAKKVDMSGLSSGVGTLHTKFSALEVMGVTALANITNSAVNAGKRIVSALTIDPIKTGFQEYETQINAVQTILANTKSKGSTIDDVNKALEELNAYADKTIYNFTEMTRNIGTFTAAGIDLETSVTAIQGIANLAAVSGSTSQQASTAMYQLSQALAAGTVKLMDWNSVVNAGMGGEMFQNALKETSKLLGTGAEAAIKAEGSFRESLRTGWLTSEVLTETLKKFTSSGAIEKVAEYTGLSKEAVQATLESAEAQHGEAEAIEHASKALAEKSGKNADEIKSALEFAKTAEDAATKVKTFTQLWDVLKESAQSGWAQTWKLIVGDFEQAKSLLTPLADFLTGFINGISDARNTLLEGALGSPFGGLIEKVTGMTKSVGKAVETVQDYNEVVDGILNGDWGTGQDRWNRLTEAGYDWAHAQNLVNEKLGDSTRHATEYTEAQNGVAKAQQYTIDQLAEMSDAKLKDLGYTEEQINALRELEEHARKAGVSLSDFIKNLDQKDGRTLLWESFENVGKSIVKIVTALGQAWKGVFDPLTSLQLYNIIAGLNEFSQRLLMSDETAGKLQRTFQGVFAILDIVTTILGGGTKLAFEALCKILGMFNLDILDFTALMGDALVKVSDWIDANNIFVKAFEFFSPHVKKAAEAIREWIDSLKDSEDLPKDIAKGIVNGFKNIPKFLRSLAEAMHSELSGAFDKIPGDVISGFVNGLWDGIKIAGQTMIELGKMLIQKICDVLGIQSPSTVFFAIGGFIIAGLVGGLLAGGTEVGETIKNIALNCIEAIKNIDFGKVLAVGLGVGLLVTANKLIDLVKSFSAPLVGLGQMFEGIGDMFEGLSSKFKAQAFEHRSKAILNMAIAVGILAAAVYALSKLEPAKLWGAVGAITVLSAIVGGLLFLTTKIEKAGDVGKAALTMVGISGSIFIMATAMKKLDGVKNMGSVLLGLTTMVLGLVGLTYAVGKFIDPKTSVDLAQAGMMFIKMSAALMSMVLVIKLASTLDSGDVVRGIGVVTAVGLLFAGLIAVSKLAGEHSNKIGGMLFKMSLALLAMVGVIKLAAGLEGGEILKGLGVVTMVGLLFAGLIAVSKLAGANASKAGTMLLLMSVALMIMVSVVKQASELDGRNLEQGLKVVATIELLFAAIIAASNLAGKHAVKAGAMLLLMSGAMVILSGVLFILSKIDPSGLDRAVAAVSTLGIIFMGLIAVTKLAGKDINGPLVTLTVAVTLLSVAIAALSFLDPDALRRSTAALTMVISTFALLVAATKYISGVKTLKLVPILLVVAGLGGIITAMSMMNPESAISNAAALSLLLLSLSGAMAILKGTKVTPKDVGTVALMGLVVAELALILGTMSHYNVNVSLETAAGLSALILALSGACLVLSKVGAMPGGIVAAVKGAAALSAFIAVIGAVALAIGGLMSLFSDDAFTAIETGLDRFTIVMEKIGIAVGSIIGGFIGGIGEGVMASLPGMGQHLSDFMDKMSGFIEGAKALGDGSALAGAKSLAEIILTLTAANIMDHLTSWFTGGTSLADFGTQLLPFGRQMAEFSSIVSGNVDEGAVIATANAGKVLAEMATMLPNTGGVAGFFAGNNDLSTFAPQLVPFGEAMASFSATVSGKINEDAVIAAANAGKVLAEMAAIIPNTGGVAAFFAGDNTMDVFGTQLIAFGNAIVGFSYTVSGKVNEDAVIAAANAGKILAEMANTLPNTGGVAAFFAGDNTMDVFGTHLIAFGNAIVGFSTAVSGKINEDAIIAAANAGKIMAELANSLPNTGGVVSWFAGDNGLDAFGTQLVAFGTSMVNFSDTVKGIDESAITTTANVGAMMSTLAKSLPKSGGFGSTFTADSDLSTFGKEIEKFGESMADFSEDVSGVDTGKISSVISQFNRIVGLVEDAAGIDVGAIDNISDALDKLGDISIDEFVESFNDASAKVSDAVTSLINALKEGVTSQKDTVSKVFVDLTKNILVKIKNEGPAFHRIGSSTTMEFARGIASKNSHARETAIALADYAKNGLKSARGGFESAGKDLGSGLVAGINAKKQAVYDAAFALGRKAVQGEKDGQASNSPSKLTIKAGKWLGEGLVIGMGQMVNQVYKSGGNLGETATSTISRAISKITDIVDSDIETQPTISPVIDLTNVKSGVSSISRLFNKTPITAYATAGVIGANINRHQNREADEIVHAINRLHKDLGKVGNTTYNSINGVTYDDGSNITDAVKTIVSAAIRERRS